MYNSYQNIQLPLFSMLNYQKYLSYNSFLILQDPGLKKHLGDFISVSSEPLYVCENTAGYLSR